MPSDKTKPIVILGRASCLQRVRDLFFPTSYNLRNINSSVEGEAKSEFHYKRYKSFGYNAPKNIKNKGHYTVGAREVK